jgi:hypothetical protein
MEINNSVLELKEGETIKVIGQGKAFMIITNVDGEIYSKTDFNREEGFK